MTKTVTITEEEYEGLTNDSIQLAALDGAGVFDTWDYGIPIYTSLLEDHNNGKAPLTPNWLACKEIEDMIGEEE